MVSYFALHGIKASTKTTMAIQHLTYQQVPLTTPWSSNFDENNHLLWRSLIPTIIPNTNQEGTHQGVTNLATQNGNKRNSVFNNNNWNPSSNFYPTNFQGIQFQNNYPNQHLTNIKVWFVFNFLLKIICFQISNGLFFFFFNLLLIY